MVYLLVQVFSNLKILEKFAKAIVQATTHYQDYELGKLASELGTTMKGLDINQISLEERMQERGW